MTTAPIRLETLPRNRSILELSCDEAREFLLKEESYCRIDLPPYFRFDSLLAEVSRVITGKNLSDLENARLKPKECEKINHLILNNKDGRYAWRPMQLIHPALYVSLVHRITEDHSWELIRDRFAEFAQNHRIRCLSLPIESLTEEKDKAEQITNWWMEIEQKSLELALEYQFVIHTDITECYSSIYTHTIPWALHSKEVAKSERRRNDYIGNVIDKHIQDMCHGQTNGIPQGSVLMDFIAEMVLGFGDLNLTESLATTNITNYRVLRYRDDYRIFVNNPQDGHGIVKLLTQVLIDLGLKLNSTKTRASDEVVRTSIKEDKLAWIGKKQSARNLQKHLLIVHNHGTEFPNSGSLARALGTFHKRISRISEWDRPLSLISIVIDIAFHNPRCYPICAAILSRMLSFLKDEGQKRGVIEKIRERFDQIPNTGHMDIWLQRISLPFAPDLEFGEPLCRLINGELIPIWNSDWISSNDLRRTINDANILDKEALDDLQEIVPVEEVELFLSRVEESL